MYHQASRAEYEWIEERINDVIGRTYAPDEYVERLIAIGRIANQNEVDISEKCLIER